MNMDVKTLRIAVVALAVVSSLCVVGDIYLTISAGRGSAGLATLAGTAVGAIAGLLGQNIAPNHGEDTPPHKKE